MPYVISDSCIDSKDHACVDVCPVDCIYEAKGRLWIHPDECTECGACEPVCPVEAISYADVGSDSGDLVLNCRAEVNDVNSPNANGVKVMTAARASPG